MAWLSVTWLSLERAANNLAGGITVGDGNLA
jgi:hypothetical protein